MILTGLFPFPPMHVAVQNRHRKPVGYHFCIGARAGGRVLRSLAGPISRNLSLQILPAPLWLIHRFLRAIQAPGSLPSFRTLHQDPEKSLGVQSILFRPFHHSAGPFSGLVAASDGHRDSERKLQCPTSVLKGKSR